jgi:hypothetical protein
VGIGERQGRDPGLQLRQCDGSSGRVAARMRIGRLLMRGCPE